MKWVASPVLTILCFDKAVLQLQIKFFSCLSSKGKFAEKKTGEGNNIVCVSVDMFEFTK